MDDTPQPEPTSPEPSRTMAIIGLVIAVVIVGALVILRYVYSQQPAVPEPANTSQAVTQTSPDLAADSTAADQQLTAADKELTASDQGLGDQAGDLAE